MMGAAATVEGREEGIVCQGSGLSIEFVPNPLAVAHQSDAARVQTFAFAERYFFVHPNIRSHDRDKYALAAWQAHP